MTAAEITAYKAEKRRRRPSGRSHGRFRGSPTRRGRSEVTTTIAFRIAKLLEVSLHDVLNGTAMPKSTCPHCGRAIDGEG